MTIINQIHRLKHFVTCNEILEAFRSIDELYAQLGVEVPNDYLTLKSRWDRLKKEDRIGMMSEDYRDKIANIITINLLEHIDLIRNKIHEKEEDILHDKITYSLERKELDEQSIKILQYLLEGLEQDENISKTYFEFFVPQMWVKFPYEISFLQNLFDEDIFNFLGNGKNLSTIHLRLELIKEIRTQLDFNILSLPISEKVIDETIIESLIESNEDEIIVDDFIEKFIDKALENLKFNFKEKVFTHLKVFSDRFAAGNLSNKEKLNPSTKPYAAFYTSFNESFGNVNNDNIKKIVDAINQRQNLKNRLYPIVERIVRIINTQRHRDFIKAENEILRNRTKKYQELRSSSNISRIGPNSIIQFVAISLFTSLITIFIYDMYFNITSEKNIVQKVEKIEKILKSLDEEVKYFDQQNIDIIDEIKEIEKMNKK